MNGNTPFPETYNGKHHPFAVGKRVGKTTLWIKKRSDIISPPPAQRMVFIDEGAATPGHYAVPYNYPGWGDQPPVRYGDSSIVGRRTCQPYEVESNRGHKVWERAVKVFAKAGIGRKVGL